MQGPDPLTMIAVRLGRYGGVKRDMEIIRAVVREIEDRTDLYPRAVQIEGVQDFIIQAHVAMLWDAGMLKGSHSDEVGSPVPSILVTDLSWEGHEFAAGVVSEGGWARLKAKFTPVEIASMSIKLLLENANVLGLAWAKSKIGLGD